MSDLTADAPETPDLAVDSDLYDASGATPDDIGVGEDLSADMTTTDVTMPADDDIGIGEDLSADLTSAPPDVQQASAVDDLGMDIGDEADVTTTDVTTTDADVPRPTVGSGDVDDTLADGQDRPEYEAPTDIGSWVGNVNPLATFGPEGAQNCGACALAVDGRLDGSSPDAVAGDYTLSVPEMEAATGRSQVAATPDEIEAGLKAAGPGAKSVIGIDRVDGPGHWFNAYFDGDRVMYIDGQTGEVGDWPPKSLGNVSAWDWNGPT